jgi:pyruvate/2-oxoglutarate dehydrogenase complex dihydrolipoamide dehydrogenase (E3) component
MKARPLNRKKYDLIVLGGGEAGKYLAWTLAKKGDEDCCR